MIVLAACGDNATPAPDPHCADWHQWGGNPQHTSASCATGQPIQRILADVVIDPLVTEEVGGADGDLIVHYQAPLIDGDRVWMVRKGGTFTPCEPEMDPFKVCTHPADLHRFESQTWSEVGYEWQGDQLVEQWTFDSDWKPPLDEETVFQPVIAGDQLVVPLAEGAVAYVDRETGERLKTVRPFDHDAGIYIVGALAEWHGVVFYNAIKIDHGNPDANIDSWLVEIDTEGRVRKADYADLVSDAPSKCYGSYGSEAMPPPGPYPVLDASGQVVLPDAYPCGSQVPGFNAAPAIAPDGTVYVVTAAQYAARYSYLLSINPGYFDVNWQTSLRGHLADGCGVAIPYATSPMDFTACRPGAPMGVDPATGMAPAGEVSSGSTSTPVVMPDGRILYGAWSFYNDDRGHLFELSRDGKVLGTYDFGWDLTPAVAVIDGQTRIAMKDNHYGIYTPGSDNGPYYLTLLSGELEQVWTYQSTDTQSCARQPDGSVTCKDDHPHGFEWCINAPAIDAAGTMYANSEDGNVYAIGADGSVKGQLLLDTALGAAYTPVTLDHAGRIYALNAGHMYVVGAN
jgi:outer membrane protein assembly factor BamB